MRVSTCSPRDSAFRSGTRRRNRPCVEATGGRKRFDNPGKLVRRCRRDGSFERRSNTQRNVREADVEQKQHSTGYTNFSSFNPGEQAAMAKRASAMWQVDKVQELVSTHPVVVYSKSWCPYCTQVKGLFEKLGVEAEVVEIDQVNEESELMDALIQLTGQRTVPNVFVGGNHVGGCDDTVKLHRDGALEGMLRDAGALSS